jgi:hypothetical protein
LTCDFWAENEEENCKNKKIKTTTDQALREDPPKLTPTANWLGGDGTSRRWDSPS